MIAGVSLDSRDHTAGHVENVLTTLLTTMFALSVLRTPHFSTAQWLPIKASASALLDTPGQMAVLAISAELTDSKICLVLVLVFRVHFIRPQMASLAVMTDLHVSARPGTLTQATLLVNLV